jgi:steroid 5-alpha reductase family enzyme
MTCLFIASRGWLLLFLAWRAHKRKGDSRFDGIKENPAIFFFVWMAQAAWVFLVSWPMMVVQSLDHGVDVIQQEMTMWDKIMLLGFGFGVSMEIHADIQKSVWVSQGRPRGFCRIGLWNISRHPNYFGEIFQWWCAWLLSYGSLVANPNADTKAVLFWFLGALSPFFSMNVLLNMSGTGIWAAEGKNLKRYYESDVAEEYKEYRESTSPLIPMFGYKNIPLSVKRRFLFEWERFEYHPSTSNKKKE